MKKSKFTEQQIAFALRQAETGTKVKEIIRQMGITEQTFYRWKRKFGGLGPSELRKLRLLEEETRRLKKLVADLSLDKAMLQEVIEKNYEGRSEAPSHRVHEGQLSGQRTSSVPCLTAGSRKLSSSVDSQRSGRSAPEDSRARGESSPIRLPPHPHLASSRRIQGEQASGPPAVSRRRLESEA
jgi:putative transposase